MQVRPNCLQKTVPKGKEVLGNKSMPSFITGICLVVIYPQAFVSLSRVEVVQFQRHTSISSAGCPGGSGGEACGRRWISPLALQALILMALEMPFN